MSQQTMKMDYTDEKAFENYPQAPHGGKLVNQVLTGKKRDEEMERARALPMIMIDLEAIITTEMIATGVMSPNKGYMNKDEYESVLKEGRFTNGLIWPIPLSFAPSGSRNEEVVRTLSAGDDIALVDDEKEPIAIMEIEDIFEYDKDERAKYVFDTLDRDHPGVDAIYRRMGNLSLGGPIHLLRRVHWGPFETLRMEPKDTWASFYEEKKFNSVAGFITGANPMHRGHEYMHRNLLEEVDGLLVQPLVEMAKREYTRHEFRMLSYRSVLESYYPMERTVFSPLRVTYVFAGPRETVLHALVMKNYGCTHAIVGRDHAGIGDYYDMYASHTVFDEFSPEELGIQVRLFHEVFYCTRCDTLATEQTCFHDKNFRINISGTAIREMLRHGIMPPKEIVRPESARIAMQGVQPKGLDENEETTLPVGKTIQKLFPFYSNAYNLGGRKRETPLELEELTNRDLEAAAMDVRTNADKLYKDISEEFNNAGDINRSMQPDWVMNAREKIRNQQEMVVKDLEEKVDQAPEKASDEFMYQDKEEAQRELEVSGKILDDLPPVLRAEDIQYRIWNPLPYHRYVGSDESDDE